MYRILFFSMLLFGFTATSAFGGLTVNVSIVAEDAVMNVGDETYIHVYGEVVGGSIGNGIYAYALNVIGTPSSSATVRSVEQLGNPLIFSNGTSAGASVIDLYGGDGDYFLNPDRGIGAPFELARLRVEALEVGVLTYLAEPANSAVLLGIPNGVLLQQPGALSVDFSHGATISVVPEPATAMLAGFAVLLVWRNRGGAKRPIA